VLGEAQRHREPVTEDLLSRCRNGFTLELTSITGIR